MGPSPHRLFKNSSSDNAGQIRDQCYWTRVSWKQTKEKFGLSRNKPKQGLVRLCFGLLFCETKNNNFWFVLVCFGVSNLCRKKLDPDPNTDPDPRIHASD